MRCSSSILEIGKWHLTNTPSIGILTLKPCAILLCTTTLKCEISSISLVFYFEKRFVAPLHETLALVYDLLVFLIAIFQPITSFEFCNISPKFVIFQFDNFLNWLLPQTWVPLYTSVTFSRMRYSHCISNRKWEDDLLAVMMKRFGISAGLVVIGCAILHYQWHQQQYVDGISQIFSHLSDKISPFFIMAKLFRTNE